MQVKTDEGKQCLEQHFLDNLFCMLMEEPVVLFLFMCTLRQGMKACRCDLCINVKKFPEAPLVHSSLSLNNPKHSCQKALDFSIRV